MRGISEIVNLIRNQALTINGSKTFSDQFPMGEGWRKMMIRINFVVTETTATGVIAEGELRAIKNVRLTTDRGEVICNLPGRALYKIAAVKAGSPPRKDANTDGGGTFRVSLPIYFIDEMMQRPEDTILDTKRYNSINLEIQLGGIADFFTTVGDGAVTATVDVEVERTRGILPKEAEPVMHIAYDVRNPADASVATEIFLEKAPDLLIKRLYTHECSDGTAGVPFSGINADDVKDLVSIEDQSGKIIKDRIHEMIQNDNKDFFSLESVLAGIEVIDFVRDGSLNSALRTGDKSQLRYSWTNKTVASGDLVSVAVEGARILK